MTCRDVVASIMFIEASVEIIRDADIVLLCPFAFKDIYVAWHTLDDPMCEGIRTLDLPASDAGRVNRATPRTRGFFNEANGTMG